MAYTYSSVTWQDTSDKNLDHMGYKVWVPVYLTSSAGFTTLVSLDEKYCPHFKTKEEARQYIDYCKDIKSSADGAATYTNTKNIADP